MRASGRAHPTARECETERWACLSEDDHRGPDAVGVRRLRHRQPGKSPGSVAHPGRKLSGMLYRSYIPAAPLSDFIEDFWLYDNYRPVHLKERILPSGTTELVINLRDNELRVDERF